MGCWRDRKPLQGPRFLGIESSFGCPLGRSGFRPFSIIYLVGIVVVSEIDPVYNLPMTALGVLPAWNTLLLLLWIFMYWNVY